MRTELCGNRLSRYSKRGHNGFRDSLRMEILAVFNIQGTLAEPRIYRYRHDRWEHDAFDLRGRWNLEAALSQS